MSRLVASLMLLPMMVLGAARPHGKVLSPERRVVPTKWLVLSTIHATAATLPEVFLEDDLVEQGGGFGFQPHVGSTEQIHGQKLEWRSLIARRGVVDLAGDAEPPDFAVAYAWTEIDAPVPGRRLLGIGSDEAIEVWLNGKPIYKHRGSRSVVMDDEVVPVALERGSNRLLVKVQRLQRGWRFACRLMDAGAQAERLTLAARNADFNKIDALLKAGVDVNGVSPIGLTAVQMASWIGRPDVVRFLVSLGAKLKGTRVPTNVLLDRVFNALISGDSPGFAVLLARDGKIVFEKGYGNANTEPRQPVTPHTPFRIASITKQFTAAAILKLQEQGKLTLSDKLSRFIPDFPRAEEVTVEQLLTHTAGIHNYTADPGFWARAASPIAEEDLIRLIGSAPYDFDPGQHWRYTNAGYVLLALIVERASGMSFADYLHATIFEPLRMKDSSASVSHGSLANEAQGYWFDEADHLAPSRWDFSWASGAGVMESSAEDLYRWNEAFYNGKVLSDPDFKRAIAAGSVRDKNGAPVNNGYGFGLVISSFRGATEFSHDGVWEGYSAYLMRLPAERFTAVILENVGPAAPEAQPDRLAELAAELLLGAELAKRDAGGADF